MSETNPPYKSSLPEISLPSGGWKSNIPNHLLEDTDPATRWLMEEVSKNTQATEFACQAAVLHNNHLRALNGQVYKSKEKIAVLEEGQHKLDKQADDASSFFKALASFSKLWEYRIFRWVFILGLITIAGYIYPYYLVHQPDLFTFIVRLLGGG